MNWLLEVKRTLKDCKVVATGSTLHRVEAEHSKEDTSEGRTTGMESRPPWRRHSCGLQESGEVWSGEFAIQDARGRHPPGRDHVSKPSVRLPGGLWGEFLHREVLHCRYS